MSALLIDEKSPENTAELLRPSMLEWVDGEAKEAEPMGQFAVSVAATLLEYISPQVRKASVGRGFVEASFLLSVEPRLVRIPDFAVVLRDQLSQHEAHPTQQNDFAVYPFAPYLAVEVVSPSNLALGIDHKILDYLNHGVQVVWLVYPETERVQVTTSLDSIRVVTGDQELTLEGILPEFRLKVSELFAAARTDA
jgi:Uma2 family endonuclease